MLKRYVLFSTIIFLLFSCSRFTDSDPDPIEVGGVVTDYEGDPIEGAQVSITAPNEMDTFTNEDGEYSFRLFIEEPTRYSFEVTQEGYQVRTQELNVDPSNEIQFPDFQLALPGEDNDEGNGDPDDDSEDSEGSAFITLDNVSNQTIQVKETGGTETTQFSFVVTDSAGTQVDNQNAVYVHFDIAEGPDGGESIYPDSVLTENGEVTASLTSGTAAGVVQVEASFTRNEETHTSKPVSVTISGGLPDENHFEVKSDRKNQVAGGSNQTNTIDVLLGDKYGNTVREGTAVYFSTNKGSIDGDRTTDQNGTTSSGLRSMNASPGLATVTVKTIDENSTTIERDLDVVFSGSPLINIESGSIDMDNFTSERFTYTLQDENGHPMVEGTTINVSANNDNLELNGDTEVTLGDYSEAGDGKTEFGFQVSKPDTVDIFGDLVLSIIAEGPNGTVRETVSYEGDEPEPADPGSIYVGSVSSNEIGVQGTMQKEDSRITFMVMDKNGVPVGSENPAEVNFRFGDRPNGGEELYPTTATTNSSGEVTTTLTSGTEAGTVQVIAEVETENGDDIYSKPVSVVIHAGLASQDHLSLASEEKNVLFSETGRKVSVTAYAGDRHGNNVPEGTMMYFTTDGGYIQGSAPINDRGEATVDLTVANPFPPGGIATITASTSDVNENNISTSTEIIFSRNPLINITPDNTLDQTFDYTVMDTEGNPMVDGTSISVTADRNDVELVGDVNFTVGSPRSTNNTNSTISNINDLTNYTFELSGLDGEIFGDVNLTIEADGPNGYAWETITYEGAEPEYVDPGSIHLQSVSSNDIGVKGTMQREDSQLTFIVRDKNGDPLGAENPAEVNFRFGDQPGGGEQLNPTTATTNSSGEVTTTLTSGTDAGPVQVVAEVVTTNGDDIYSNPVSVVIHAGLADQNHFTVDIDEKNVPFSETGRKVSVTAYAGDRYGNNVPEGTMVYFTTDGGYIEGSAPINGQGEATVDLTVANPEPQGGIATITASTSDVNEGSVTASDEIIFSGDPLITITPDNFNVGNDEDQTFEYTVMDSEGNPMVAGTTITVTVEGDDLEVIGDVDITVGAPNSDFTNFDQLTEYSFNFKDTDDTVDETPVFITIEVEGDNGTARKVIEGRKSKIVSP